MGYNKNVLIKVFFFCFFYYEEKQAGILYIKSKKNKE